jgi:hypothetical protein
VRGQPGAEPPHGVDGRRVSVATENLVAGAQRVHQIPALAAAGVEQPHAWADAAAQELIEEIDVDLAELVVKVNRHVRADDIARSRCIAVGSIGAATLAIDGGSHVYESVAMEE